MEKAKEKVPRTQRALVANGPGSLGLKPVPVPRLAPGEVLVRTAAVALNPSDHKFLDKMPTIGAISGVDFAGTVVRVGSDVREDIQLGHRVLGPAFGANPSNPGNGAFAHYVAMPGCLCVRLPDDLDFPAGASLPTAVFTVGFAFRSLGIELDVEGVMSCRAEPKRMEEQLIEGSQGCSRFVLVHGGATATGTVAIQLLRVAGYIPLATCSPANSALVRDRGAAAVFDYSSTTVRDEIRELTRGQLSLALDCIGTPASTVLCYGAIGDGGGRYTTLEPYSARLVARRRDIVPDWVLAWTLFGQELKLPDAYYRPALPEDLVFGGAWAAKMQRLLEAGLLLPHPLDVDKGGLPVVTRGLDLLRKHQIRGKKLVVVI